MDANKVLIIEDDPDLRRGLNIRLREANYETVFAEDAVTGLIVAKNEEPDLILLDLGLPGIDGFLVLDRMKQNASLAGTPVIVVSARDPQTNEKRALDAGAAAYFQKPVDGQELMLAIHRALFK